MFFKIGKTVCFIPLPALDQPVHDPVVRSYAQVFTIPFRHDRAMMSEKGIYRFGFLFITWFIVQGDLFSVTAFSAPSYS